jgi:two-component system chemotaxis sensor kinase CheA
MDIKQFYQAFFEEADELLAEMELLLLGLDLQTPDSEHLNAIFRAAHSIKGGAATFGFTALTDTTHLLENLLDKARHSELTLSTRMMDGFLETKDVLQKQLEAYRTEQEPDPDMVARSCAQLSQLSQEAEQVDPAPVASPVAEPAPPPAAPTDATGPVLKVCFSRVSESDGKSLSEELANLGTVLEQTQGPDSLSVRLETTCEADDLLAVCCFIIDADQIEITPEAAPQAVPQAAPEIIPEAAPAAPVKSPPKAAPAPAGASNANKESNSIRVDVEKVDQIINLVGELVITQAMLAQNSAQIDPALQQQLAAGLADLERNTRSLQESVMSIRMIPMSVVFNRFPRMLRDLAAKLGKKVDFVTQGEATELDKGLVEKITDPLTHLVRNSCDHGIESPAERLAKGKREIGTITLAASHQGGSIVIEVRDDGKGLSRDKLLKKARERGIDAPDSMADAEVWQLIFAPGFSTAEVVTDVSGRGVGMDVVKKNIAALGGSVEIESAEGYGMIVKVRLPLTLAIMDSMSVGVGGECYILPLSSVVESFQLTEDGLKSIGNSGRLVQVRDEYLPVIDLERVFDVPRQGNAPTASIMVVVEADGSRVAIMVDELLGQQQVVVKNLEANYRRVDHISGATIMGDGRVALIIDVGSLVRRSRH